MSSSDPTPDGSPPAGRPRSVDAAGGGRPRTAALTVVVGGGQVGRLIARRLAGGGRVRFVDDDEAAVDRAATRHEATYLADLRDRRSLAAALDGATHAIVATGRDATNLLVTQHCRTLGVPVVVAVVADPRTHDAYPPDVVRVCAAAAVVEDVVAAVPADPPPEEA